FGIAKVISSDDPAITAAALTDTGQILGTPQYMAPEQIFGEKDIDARADVWSLGVILYQALAGVRPFEGANPGQIFKAIALDPPTPRADRAPNTPRALADLVSRMLVHARADRLADLDEVARALDGIGNEPRRASPAPAPRRALGFVAASATAIGAILVLALRP